MTVRSMVVNVRMAGGTQLRYPLLPAASTGAGCGRSHSAHGGERAVRGGLDAEAGGGWSGALE